MSHTLLDHGPLIVGTYCGPADERGSRRRWQFAVRDRGDVASLTDEQAAELVRAIVAHAPELLVKAMPFLEPLPFAPPASGPLMVAGTTIGLWRPLA